MNASLKSVEWSVLVHLQKKLVDTGLHAEHSRVSSLFISERHYLTAGGLVGSILHDMGKAKKTRKFAEVKRMLSVKEIKASKASSVCNCCGKSRNSERSAFLPVLLGVLAS